MRMNFKPRNTRKAQELRSQATPAERELWRYLNTSKLDGHKFSRQIPIGPFICDFVCRRSKLVVELDGFSHENTSDRDAKRTLFLEREGYKVVRFLNSDVFANMDGVLTAIGETLMALPTPSPSRLREGDIQP